MPNSPSATWPSSAPIKTNQDDYHSSEDEDFNPDAVCAVGESGAEDEENEQELFQVQKDGANPKAKLKKRKRAQLGPHDQEDQDDGDDLDFSNSGDEATIKKGKRRKGNASANGTSLPAAEDDGGGEGGLIKTRAQRAKEQREKKAVATVTDSTVNVDALWASMTGAAAAHPGQLSAQATSTEQTDGQRTQNRHSDSKADGMARLNPPAPTTGPLAEDIITIKRSFVFAGETITEEKQVARSSAEARLHLDSLAAQEPTSTSATASTNPRLRRPRKRASIFDPGAASQLSAPQPKPKLNTIEKSKVDWAGFVDKEGISDELDEHSRAKEGYLGRMDFLGRVHANREAEARREKKM